ncbi:MAG: hypothetical protein HKN03_16610 [Acidimicrobiales bacterium]|nr:hypothetical protein [Acidimicrobiales bacterium]
MITAGSPKLSGPLHRPAPPASANSVEIHLPAALWVAKLTAGEDAHALLRSADGLPTHWTTSPLATSRIFAGILSADDVGTNVEPNLCPTQSLPLPGDRIIIARTGRRVEVFGAVEITGLTVTRCGAVRIGHSPLVTFTEPVDVRQGRRHNQLLEEHWDQLFGRSARDRRLLPLSDAAVALTFSAFGFSLEQLFSETGICSVESVRPAPAWSLDAKISGIKISSTLAAARIADGVAAFHGLREVFDHYQSDSIEITGTRPGRDLLLSVTEADHTHFVVAVGLSQGEGYRVNPAYRHLIESSSASTVLAIESQHDWNIFNLDAKECIALQHIENEQLERRN